MTAAWWPPASLPTAECLGGGDYIKLHKIIKEQIPDGLLVYNKGWATCRSYNVELQRGESAYVEDRWRDWEVEELECYVCLVMSVGESFTPKTFYSLVVVAVKNN